MASLISQDYQTFKVRSFRGALINKQPITNNKQLNYFAATFFFFLFLAALAAFLAAFFSASIL